MTAPIMDAIPADSLAREHAAMVPLLALQDRNLKALYAERKDLRDLLARAHWVLTGSGSWAEWMQLTDEIAAVLGLDGEPS